jgi:hypothetical protein
MTPNQPMQPTAPLRNDFSEIATTPCRAAYLFLVRRRMRALVFALTFGTTAIVHPSDNSIEVTLEDTPRDQRSSPRSFEAWRHKPPADETNSDANYIQWRNKFESGSDKPLGSPADTAAIKALFPATPPPTIRWVSRFVVVVASPCQSNVRARCLYVFEKRGMKWKLSHCYRWPPQVF